MNKLIFLDIDGVLNYNSWYYNSRNIEKEKDLDLFCIERINILTKLTKAYIVISSDWRYDMNQCKYRLENAGLNGIIIGHTPINLFNKSEKDKSRGREIETFLQENSSYFTNYVIIDDRTDFKKDQLLNHYVNVDQLKGFTDEDLKKTIYILNFEI